MDKYPEFVITRNEMRQCKRSNDVHADKNGCREYSIMSCPHGCLLEVVVASNSITHSKANAVRDHLVVCPNFTGERPVKRGKPSEKSSVLVPFTCNHPHHDKQSQEWDEMKKRLVGVESKLDITLKVVAQHHIWWQKGAELVGLQPPQDPPVILGALKLLRDQSASTTLSMTSDSTHLLQQQETFKLMLTQKDDTISQKDEMMSEYKASLEQKTTENSELKLELDNERIHVEKMRKEVEAASRASVEASKREAEARAREAEKMEALAASKKREEVLNSRYKESLRSLEKVTKNHKHIGKSLLSHAQQTQKSYVLQSNKLPKIDE